MSTIAKGRSDIVNAPAFLLLVLFICGGPFLRCLATNGNASGECVIIVAGKEAAGEQHIRYTGDNLFRAMQNVPGGSDVRLLYPSRQQGEMGTNMYDSKEDFLSKLFDLVCRKECKNVVMMFVGHGTMFSIDDGTTTRIRYGFSIGAAEPLWGEDVANIIDNCEKTVKLYVDFCWSKVFLNDLLSSTPTGVPDSLVQAALSATQEREGAIIYPDKSPMGHMLFSKFFLQDYYLIITNPNVMKDIRAKAMNKKINLPVMVIIMDESFKSAQIKTTEAHSKQHPVSPIEIPDKPVIQYPRKPHIRLWDNDSKRIFSFYKVEDKAIKKKNNKCKVVGFVTDRFGNPIAPLIHIECKIKCSLAKFKYIEDGTDKTFTLEKGANGRYTLKMGSTNRKFRFLYLSKKPLLKNGKNYGLLWIRVLPGDEFQVHVQIYVDEPDPKNSGKMRRGRKNAQIKSTKYNTAKGTLTIEYEHEGKTERIIVQFYNYGKVEVRPGGRGSMYECSNVTDFNFIDCDGHPIGDLVLNFNARQGELYVYETGEVFLVSNWSYLDTDTYNAVAGNFKIMGAVDLDHGVANSTWTNTETNAWGLVQEKHYFSIPPPVTNLTATYHCSEGSLDVQLTWALSEDEFYDDETTLGFKIIRYNTLTPQKEVHSLRGDEYGFDDLGLDPSGTYTYQVYTFAEHNVAMCEIEPSGQIYSYPDYVDVDNVECYVVPSECPSDNPSLSPSDQSDHPSLGPSDRSDYPSLSPSDKSDHPLGSPSSASPGLSYQPTSNPESVSTSSTLHQHLRDRSEEQTSVTSPIHEQRPRQKMNN